MEIRQKSKLKLYIHSNLHKCFTRKFLNEIRRLINFAVDTFLRENSTSFAASIKEANMLFRETEKLFYKNVTIWN